ncbi:MAG: hypothetical protein ACFBWO_09015 [Paracoccaceae bacterium]
MRLALALPVLALVVAGCAASPTPYAPADPLDASDRGYTDAALAPGRYRVAFSANSATPRETVEDYLLYRAAEVALTEQCPYFRVDRRQTVEGDRGDVGIGDGLFVNPSIGIGVVGAADLPEDVAPEDLVSIGRVRLGFGFGFPLVPYSYPYYGGRRRSGLTAYAEITCFEGLPVEAGPFLYETREVIDAIGPRVSVATP